LPVPDEFRYHPHKFGHPIDERGSGSLQVQRLGDSVAGFEDIIIGIPRIFISLRPAKGRLFGPLKSERCCGTNMISPFGDRGRINMKKLEYSSKSLRKIILSMLSASVS
jgi:hypothetical protein